jgi:hypothetical protein
LILVHICDTSGFVLKSGCGRYLQYLCRFMAQTNTKAILNENSVALFPTILHYQKCHKTKNDITYLNVKFHLTVP